MNPKTIENKTELAKFLGISRNTLYKWINSPGFPVESDGSVSPFKAGEWRVTRQLATDEEDDDFEDSDELTFWKIKKLKEEYRAKKLANDQTESELIPRGAYYQWMITVALKLRDAGDRLARGWGNEAAQVMIEAIEDAEEEINGSDFNSRGTDSE